MEIRGSGFPSDKTLARWHEKLFAEAPDEVERPFNLFVEEWLLDISVRAFHDCQRLCAAVFLLQSPPDDSNMKWLREGMFRIQKEWGRVFATNFPEVNVDYWREFNDIDLSVSSEIPPELLFDAELSTLRTCAAQVVDMRLKMEKGNEYWRWRRKINSILTCVGAETRLMTLDREKVI